MHVMLLCFRMLQEAQLCDGCTHTHGVDPLISSITCLNSYGFCISTNEVSDCNFIGLVVLIKALESSSDLMSDLTGSVTACLSVSLWVNQWCINHLDIYRVEENQLFLCFFLYSSVFFFPCILKKKKSLTFKTLVFVTSGILSMHNHLVTLQRERKTFLHLV